MRRPITNGNRIGIRVLILIVSIFVSWRFTMAFAQADPAADQQQLLRLNRATFAPSEAAWWAMRDMEGVLRFVLTDVYLCAPQPGQDRDAWLATMREYREQRRAGGYVPGTGRFRDVISLNFQGKGYRGWVRLVDELGKAYALQPGDRLRVTVEARWLAGNNELCLGFDYNDAESGKWQGWSNVVETFEIPQDGEYHRLTTEVVVPEGAPAGTYLKPLIGMDTAHNPEPGQLEIKEIDYQLDDAERMEAVRAAIGDQRLAPLDQATYDHPGRAWMTGAFTCHFTFMYDLSFYDPEAGEYTLDTFLADGEREFGGYDILLLWHAYPRIGLDQRNQLDFYRDMPGGLEGLRELVNDAHDRGVMVFINYNPWDVSTHREGMTDEEMLAALVGEIGVDGIFLDTMSGDSPVLRQKLEEVRPGISLAPENNLTVESLSICNGSWAQWLGDSDCPPGLEHRKWLIPRHMRWQIARNNYTHRDEIRRAFFNGSGMMIWENIFGVWNRWNASDRRVWRRAAAILHEYQENFASDAWEPFYPAYPVPSEGPDALYKTDGIFINRWPGERATVYTLYKKEPDVSPHSWYGRSFWHQATYVPLFDVPYEPGVQYYDLWNGRPARTERQGDKVVIHGFLDRLSGLGCIAAVPEAKMDEAFHAFIEKQRLEADQIPVADDLRGGIESPLEIRPFEHTEPGRLDQPPQGMVAVPGGPVRVQVTHQRRECGCYPDPGTPADQWEKFTHGTPHNGQVRHDYTVDVAPFLIDEAAVTNAEFKRFLDESGYQPRHTKNFLKHWPNGQMPAELADHPVVYVDLDDARAYAKWAGKRLPTEEEWHLAAQGTDGRKWPWGNEEPDADRANTTGATLPVRDLPASRSPYGCYQMSGNVYEWTESERSDGHTRFCIIRGGSYYSATGSDWYMDGGPRPCDHHAKFIMMWPGVDRCSTIGFRCVKDVAS